VIQDVDDTLKELLVQEVPLDTAAIDIKFEMPTHEWSSKVSKPTVNVYLWDIRENLELRSVDRLVTRRDKDAGTGTQERAPVRVDLAYLISAWTTDIADEHQLLGNILNALVRFPTLPAEILQGSLQVQPFALQAWIARPERMPNPWDFWGHVENRMKSALSYVVTASVVPFTPEEVRLVKNTLTNIEQLPRKQPTA
jgi:hypothetical protein